MVFREVKLAFESGRTVLFVKIFLLIGVAFGAVELPYFSAKDLTPYWKSETKGKTQPLEIAQFALTDQNLNQVTDNVFKNKITVMNFFYPMMMNTLQGVNNKLSDIKDFQLVSLSITPALDTPLKLRDFVKKRKLKDQNWRLLTGDSKVLTKLADHFKANVDVASKKTNEFVHSEAAYLFDKEGRVRGIYNTKSKAHMELLIEDVKALVGKAL
jgi:protein SCO1/2